MIENCHLWQKKELLEEDLKLKEVFELLHTYIKESHLWRYLLKCRTCGQLYFFEFYEEIDWVKGNDPQYVTWIPVETEEESAKLAQLQPIELLIYYPRIQKDWPTDSNVPAVCRLR